MPRMYEFELTRTSTVSIVVPDDMSQDDLEVLVKKHIETVFSMNADDELTVSDDYDVTAEDAKEANFVVSDDGTDFIEVEEADWLSDLCVLEDIDDENNEDEIDKETPEW